MSDSMRTFDESDGLEPTFYNLKQKCNMKNRILIEYGDSASFNLKENRMIQLAIPSKKVVMEAARCCRGQTEGKAGND